jgi:hypothetical protein
MLNSLSSKFSFFSLMGKIQFLTYFFLVSKYKISLGYLPNIQVTYRTSEQEVFGTVKGKTGSLILRALFSEKTYDVPYI